MPCGNNDQSVRGRDTIAAASGVVTGFEVSHDERRVRVGRGRGRRCGGGWRGRRCGERLPGSDVERGGVQRLEAGVAVGDTSWNEADFPTGRNGQGGPGLDISSMPALVVRGVSR